MQRQWSEEAERGAALRSALLCTPAGQNCGNAPGDPQLQVLPQISASATCISVQKVMHDYCIYLFFFEKIFSSRVIGVENAEPSEVVSAVHTTRNI